MVKVSRRSQIAPFEVMEVLDRVTTLRAGGRDILSLCAGEPSGGAPTDVRERAARTFSASGGSLGYTSALGTPDLRAAVAGHYGRWYDLDVDPGAVGITTGASGAFVVVCLAVVGAQDDAGGLTYWCMSLAGGLLAFLWHNAHPARVFMGDVGAEALGAALAAVALVSGHALLLLVSGIAMVSEAVSDIVQVGYFKYTRRRYGEGRRVFRMAPLHHHFEALGMDEVQVTTRFWIATAVASFLAVAVRGVH